MNSADVFSDEATYQRKTGLVALDQGRLAEARQKSEQAESLVQTLPDDFVKAIDDQILAIVLSRELKSRIRARSQLKN